MRLRILSLHDGVIARPRINRLNPKLAIQFLNRHLQLNRRFVQGWDSLILVHDVNVVCHAGSLFCQSVSGCTHEQYRTKQ